VNAVGGPPTSRVILVVDDEPGLRRVACTILEREGYAAIEAEGGHQAGWTAGAMGRGLA